MVWKHYRVHGRRLPWRKTTNPYRILVSEIMLQQTQVDRVMPYYARFLKRFPTLKTLARANLSEVLSVWSGLGYNRRAKYLRDAARHIEREYHGVVPNDPQLLERLPGIGVYTARAIAAFAFNHPVALIETNIRAVFMFHFFKNKASVRDSDILELVEKTLPRHTVREWYWALMDYGGTLKKEGKVRNVQSAHYVRQKPFVGSRRELRGNILRTLSAKGTSIAALSRALAISQRDVRPILTTLITERLVTVDRGGYRIAR